MIFALVLAVVLSWYAPLFNCGGVDPLTDLDRYEVPIFRAVILEWLVCSDDAGTPFPCPVYSRSLVRHLIPLDAGPCGSAPAPCLGLADPGPGEVLGWLDPEAIDTAGNSSADCSP